MLKTFSEADGQSEILARKDFEKSTSRPNRDKNFATGWLASVADLGTRIEKQNAARFPRLEFALSS